MCVCVCVCVSVLFSFSSLFFSALWGCSYIPQENFVPHFHSGPSLSFFWRFSLIFEKDNVHSILKPTALIQAEEKCQKSLCTETQWLISAQHIHLIKYWIRSKWKKAMVTEKYMSTITMPSSQPAALEVRPRQLQRFLLYISGLLLYVFPFLNQ